MRLQAANVRRQIVIETPQWKVTWMPGLLTASSPCGGLWGLQKGKKSLLEFWPFRRQKRPFWEAKKARGNRWTLGPGGFGTDLWKTSASRRSAPSASSSSGAAGQSLPRSLLKPGVGGSKAYTGTLLPEFQGSKLLKARKRREAAVGTQGKRMNTSAKSGRSLKQACRRLNQLVHQLGPKRLTCPWDQGSGQ